MKGYHTLLFRLRRFCMQYSIDFLLIDTVAVFPSARMGAGVEYIPFQTAHMYNTLIPQIE